MDAVEFIKTKKRMCMHYQKCGCVGCPSIDHREMLCEDVVSKNAEKAVEIVEEWLKTHPVKTNADKIEELTGTKIEIVTQQETHNAAYIIRVTIDGKTESGIAKLKRWFESEYVEK